MHSTARISGEDPPAARMALRRRSLRIVVRGSAMSGHGRTVLRTLFVVTNIVLALESRSCQATDLPTPPRTRPRAPPRRTLNPDAIVDAAMAVLDEGGVDAPQHARGRRPPRHRPVLALRPLRGQGRAARGDDRPGRRRPPDRRGRQRPVAGAAQGRDPRRSAPAWPPTATSPSPRSATSRPARTPCVWVDGLLGVLRDAGPPGPRDRLRRRHPPALRARPPPTRSPCTARRTMPDHGAQYIAELRVVLPRRCRPTASRTSSRWPSR